MTLFLDLNIQSLKTCWEVIEKKQEDERNAAQVYSIFKKLLVAPQTNFPKFSNRLPASALAVAARKIA